MRRGPKVGVAGTCARCARRTTVRARVREVRARAWRCARVYADRTKGREREQCMHELMKLRALVRRHDDLADSAQLACKHTTNTLHLAHNYVQHTTYTCTPARSRMNADVHTRLSERSTVTVLCACPCVCARMCVHGRDPLHALCCMLHVACCTLRVACCARESSALGQAPAASAAESRAGSGRSRPARLD